jgi:tripartite-type tricarboxylate transporter receptor subunit TctC
MISRRDLIVLSAAQAMTPYLFAGESRAETEYPTKAVRIIVPVAAGGPTDIVARTLADKLSAMWRQQVFIENKPGAGNNLATEVAAHSPPDGYTVFLVNPANTINATLYKSLSFNFIQDMAPVAGFIRVANVMEVNPAVPAHTVKEFIDYAKANPGKINMASSGVGTSVHLSGALFMMMTGIDMVHVPYRGAAPALIDLLAGQDQVMFDNLPSSIAHIDAGRLRALAVTTATRSAALPDVPTVAETVPGYEASAFFGMAVPAGTPRPIIDKLNRTVNQALASPTVQRSLAEMGGTLIAGTPEDFGKIIADETDKWSKVVKATGATAE